MRGLRLPEITARGAIVKRIMMDKASSRLSVRMQGRAAIKANILTQTGRNFGHGLPGHPALMAGLMPDSHAQEKPARGR